MKNLLKRLCPESLFFFGFAVITAVTGFLNGYEYKVLHVIVVVGNVICGLLWQYRKDEEDKKD